MLDGAKEKVLARVETEGTRSAAPSLLTREPTSRMIRGITIPIPMYFDIDAIYLFTNVLKDPNPASVPAQSYPKSYQTFTKLKYSAFSIAFATSSTSGCLCGISCTPGFSTTMTRSGSHSFCAICAKCLGAGSSCVP
jgi:hypothetical protein